MERIKLDMAGPSDREWYIECRSGNEYELTRNMAGAVDIIRQLPTGDLFSIVGVSDSDLNEYLIKRKAALCDKALRYVRDTVWHWRESGEKAVVDQDFIEDFLYQRVKKRTLHKQLKERRIPLIEVLNIVAFFEGEDLK